MNLSCHFCASAILTLLLWPFFGSWSLLAFVSGFLVDADHYLYYVLSGRGISLRKAYRFFMHERPAGLIVIDVFHTAEAIIAAAVLGLLWFPAWALFAGLAVHLLMDAAYEKLVCRECRRYHSIIEWLLKRKK